jgi:hypothetical protein
VNPLVVLDNADQADQLPKGTRWVASDTQGIAQKRQWIEDNLVSEGEWYLSLDDDLEILQKVRSDFYEDEVVVFDDFTISSSEWRKIYREESRDIVGVAEELIFKCQEVGTIFGAIQSTRRENYFFRPKKWSTINLTGAIFFVKQKFGRWREEVDTLEDMDMICQVLRAYGSVVINQWVYPITQDYTPGGIGTEAERNLVEKSERMLADYPGLLKRYKDHPWFLTLATRSKKRWLSSPE